MTPGWGGARPEGSAPPLAPDRRRTPGYVSKDQAGQLPDCRGDHGQVLQASQQTPGQVQIGTGQQAALLSNPATGKDDARYIQLSCLRYDIQHGGINDHTSNLADGHARRL
jgi:hypothetical protein